VDREEYANRIDRCLAIASDRSLDGLVIVSKSPERAGDVEYLTGHKPGLPGHVTSYGFRGRGFGAVVLSLSGSATLCVTTPFYQSSPVVDDVLVGSDFPGVVAQAVRSAHLEQGVVGLVGSDVLPISLYSDLTRYLPGVLFAINDDIVMNHRAVKSDWEIEILRDGAAIADEVSTLTRTHLKEGLTELQVQAFIVEALKARGVSNAFATCQSGVVNSGEPMIAGGATSKKLERGDMVHMEFNGKLDGYMIDVCRSTVVGAPSARQKQILDLVLEMLSSAIAAMCPGVVAEQLERITGSLALQCGLAEHHTLAYGGPGTYLGHGIGLGIDEPPILAEGMKHRLKEGMVITVEPGIYRTEVGGARIENEVLVTRDGAESLNTADPKWW